MKLLTYLKYFLILFLILNVLLVAGGIIKYKLALSSYVNKEQKATTALPSEGSSQEGTQVFLMGTIHFETDKIKRDDFYQYLDSLSPAVILFERDSKSVSRLLSGTNFMDQLKSAFSSKNQIEPFIALRYIEQHPESVVLPYEWEERDAYHFKHKILSRSDELLSSIIGLHRNDQLDSEQAAVVTSYQSINRKLNTIHFNATVNDLNNQLTDSILRIRQDYVYKKLPEIAKDREELSSLSEFVPIHMGYWDTRNLAMVKNILKQIKSHPDKRIVVFNGYYHRYYLMDELKKYEEELNFTLR